MGKEKLKIRFDSNLSPKMITIKKLAKKLKRIGKIRFFIPKPRSERNNVWKKIKKKMEA